MTIAAAGREKYGIDAPTVVRNLGVGGIALLVIGLVAGHLAALAPLAPTLVGTGTGMTIGAGWMLISSLWLKQIVMRRLLDTRAWRGDEQVLDIRHARAYAAQLRALGAAVRITGPILLWGPLGWGFSAIKPG